jgi:hypothetical protein
MKPYKKTKIARNTMHRKEYKVEAMGLREWYWNDGVMFYPVHRGGRKNPHKRIRQYQVRRYRTWKYNRKTKWKVGGVV